MLLNLKFNKYVSGFLEETKIGQKSWSEVISMYDNLKSEKDWYDQNTMDFWSQIQDKIVESFLGAYRKGQKYLPWKKVSANDLIRVWKNFAKNNYTVHDRDLNLLDKISHQIMYNIVALWIGNLLSGHDQIDPKEFLSEYIDEDNIDDNFFENFLSLEDGSWVVSDYGLPYLLKLFPKIYNAKTAEEKLYAIDKVLNVVHQRNDLSEYFVEGGVRTLMKVSE